MSSWHEFVHMGGYAFYVWTSYAVATVVMIANLVAPHVRRRRLQRELAQATRLAQRRNR